MSSAFDWDMIISDFNINRAKQENEISSYDKRYLLSLAEGNIADLHAIKDIKGFEIDSTYSYSYSLSSSKRYSNRNRLDTKVYHFLKGDAEGDWRSFSSRRNEVRNDISKLISTGKLDTLDLSKAYIVKTIAPLIKLTKLKSLNLAECKISDWENLKGLKSLESITVSYLKNEDLKYFKQLNNIKSIDIKDTPVDVQRIFIEGLAHVDVY
jgi:Leucine-rich repeat (LRR) protein